MVEYPWKFGCDWITSFIKIQSTLMVICFGFPIFSLFRRFSLLKTKQMQYNRKFKYSKLIRKTATAVVVPAQSKRHTNGDREQKFLSFFASLPHLKWNTKFISNITLYHPYIHILHLLSFWTLTKKILRKKNTSVRSRTESISDENDVFLMW